MGDRKDLIRELLSKPVTYADIRLHKLTDEEIRHLYNMDYMTRKEFVFMYRQLHSNDKTSAAPFIQWRRERNRIEQSRGAQVVKANFKMHQARGFDMTRLNEGYKHHVPTREYFESTHVYVTDFLLNVRQEYYARTMSTKDAAVKLGITRQHLTRLAREGKLELCTESKRVKTDCIVKVLKEQMYEKLNTLEEISFKDLQDLFDGFMHHWSNVKQKPEEVR